jgi:Leucine-rich repeat (LRR) protein
MTTQNALHSFSKSDVNSTICDLIPRLKEKNAPTFEFRNRNLTTIPKELTEQCSWLKTLDLSYNSLKQIPEHLKILTNLTELNLRQNLITNIPDWFFSSFSGLNHLNLSNNRLTRFDSQFRQMTQLQRLILSHNQITHIPDDVFMEMPKLLGQFYFFKMRFPHVCEILHSDLFFLLLGLCSFGFE